MQAGRHIKRDFSRHSLCAAWVHQTSPKGERPIQKAIAFTHSFIDPIFKKLSPGAPFLLCA